MGSCSHLHTTGSHRDGLQVECPNDIRKEAGIAHPVFFTSPVWELINPSERLQSYGQSLDGRLWDTLYMFTHAVRTGKITNSSGLYKVVYLVESGKKAKHKEVELLAVIGAKDINDPSPAITIMMPEDY